MSTDIVKGSIAAIAQETGKGIAETFMQADCVILVDTSGSMDSKDSRGGRSRYEVSCEELRVLQAEMPGKIAVIAFSSAVVFCPGGVPTYMGGGTNMAEALYHAKSADVDGMKFILISDGEPDSKERTLEAARQFRQKISTIYVGPEELPAGRAFLEKLAAACGGASVTADKANELASSVKLLLRA